MYYSLLLIFTAFLLNSGSGQRYSFSSQKTYIPFNISKKDFKKKSYYFYRAIITGNKNNLDQKIKSISKRYGFIHILTPSGIHLSSIKFFLLFGSHINLIIIFILFLYLQSKNTYFSLERVLIFSFIHGFFTKICNKKTSIDIVFLMTILSSIFIGHTQKNHLSFTYSFLFWGTIILFRNNPIKLIIYLNISLLFSSSLTGDYISPLSIIINPIITSLTTIIFPVLLINNFLPEILQINFIPSHILNIFLNSIETLKNIDPFPLIRLHITIIFSIHFSFYFKNKKIFLLTLLFMTTSISNKDSKVDKKDFYINLGDKTEIVSKNKKWINFIDQRCYIFHTTVNCKKKPSEYGGPSI